MFESFQTTPETAHLYRLNGDYNPLHASPEAGKALGFGGMIIHGLFSWHVVAQLVLRHYGGSDGQDLEDFEARFILPVKPGDKLDIFLWDMGIPEAENSTVATKSKEIRFIVKVKGGVVLSDGRALLSSMRHSSML